MIFELSLKEVSPPMYTILSKASAQISSKPVDCCVDRWPLERMKSLLNLVASALSKLVDEKYKVSTAVRLTRKIKELILKEKDFRDPAQMLTWSWKKWPSRCAIIQDL